MSCSPCLTHRCFCDVEYMSRLFASLMLLFKLIEDTQLRIKHLLELEHIVRFTHTLRGGTLGLRTQAQDAIASRWSLQAGIKNASCQTVIKLRTSGSP